MNRQGAILPFIIAWVRGVAGNNMCWDSLFFLDSSKKIFFTDLIKNLVNIKLVSDPL